MSRDYSYPEELLHWVWKTSRLESTHLETVSGEPVTVFDHGRSNPADGPDFLNARVQIDSLQWFGDVEIHWRTGDWNQHNHHTDSNYNRVILHLVWNHDGSPVTRQDRTSIPTLEIKPYLSANLQAFLEHYQQPDHLPCSSHLSYLTQSAFEQQLNKAKHQYFEQKVNDLLNFWDASLPPSLAWKQMLSAGLFDALGVPHNRRPLRELAHRLFPHLREFTSKEDFISLAMQSSGIQSKDSAERNRWNHKGCRPSNQPKVRIRQAAAYMWQLYKSPFKDFLAKDPMPLWNRLQRELSRAELPGRQTREIMCATVWFPSFFILGNLFASAELRSRSYELWKNQEIRLPKSLLKPFLLSGIPVAAYQKSLGAIYQLRSYCEPRHCEKCKVFKSVISS